MKTIYPNKSQLSAKEREILMEMNWNISFRYDGLTIFETFPRTFKKMREKYPQLKDIETAKKYFERL